MSWPAYLRSGRDKIADAMLPFRMNTLRREEGDLEATVARLRGLGEAKRGATGADLEHERIVRAATGGAVLAGPFGGGAGAPRVDVSGTLQGHMESTVKVEVAVTPSSELLRAVATAKATAKGEAKAAVGTSMSEASPGTRNGVGRQ